MIASPLRPPVHGRNRASLLPASSPNRGNALRRFTFVRDHNASMASSRPALTEAPQRNQPHWSRPVNSGPRPCLFDVGFPLSGLQDRTSTSVLNIRARHTGSGPTGLTSVEPRARNPLRATALGNSLIRCEEKTMIADTRYATQERPSPDSIDAWVVERFGERLRPARVHLAVIIGEGDDVAHRGVGVQGVSWL